MTSNIGAREIQASRPFGFGAAVAGKPSYEDIRREVDRALEHVFTPEFLNRIDEVLVFRPLAKDSLRTILGLLLEEMIPLKLELTEAALDHLVEQSYDPAMGARPVRRTIQRLVRNPLSLMLARGELREEDVIAISIEDGALAIRRSETSGAALA
jgi:ATP-dependent Clp protease ATP-binding subunit ClpC